VTLSLLAARFSSLIAGFKHVIGMPDYAAYVKHLRIAHPEAPVPSEREYYDEYLKGRYESGPTRCC
jgi:uncharacterized short protein YbdD (DUF466 family)